MKTKRPEWKLLALLASALLCCALSLPAQTVPTITTQPANQTVQAGTNATFTVAVAGTGPFNYQWQINGANLPNNLIATVAGNGSLAYAGDGGLAINASLNNPTSVALGGAGNLYIADYENGRIRKVDGIGNITTVAGTNSGGFSGDGGAAINAQLSGPAGVALDGAGNLYIADYGNGRIRKVDTSGYITTVAGTNRYGYSGDGGAAANAILYCPFGVALDASGNLYIADTSDNRIRKVDTNGIISTVAGTNSNGFSGDGGAAADATLNGPTAVALDAFGGLYISDCNNNRVRKVDTNGIITTQAGDGYNAYWGDGGMPTNACLWFPCGMAWDAAGNLFVADQHNGRIRKVFLYAGYPTLTLINVSATNAGNYTVVITNSSGSVTSTVATLTVQAPPIITVQPASRKMGMGSNAIFSVAASGSGPFGYLWFLASTNLVQGGTNNTLLLSGLSTNDAGNYTVVVTNAYGSITSQVATLTVGFPPSVVTPPGNVAVLEGTNVSFSVSASGTGPFSYQWQFNGADFLTNIIKTVAGNGTAAFAGDGGPASAASLNNPQGAALDAGGNLFIADYYNNVVRKVDTNGIITTVAGNGTGTYVGDGTQATNASLYQPIGLALDGAGSLYIADTSNGRIRKVNTNGVISTVAGGEAGGDGVPATYTSLHDPSGLAFDSSGNLYIADTANNRVRKVDQNSIITTVAGINGGGPVGGYSGDGGLATNASLSRPAAVAFDDAGNLYIADTYNNRIRKVGTNGIITTAAGGKYGDDGGAATNASLNGPECLALDFSGNLYIADTFNNRIRKVDTSGIITTVSGGKGAAGYSGDGGAATNASMYWPSGVALDACGNLYIADTYNNRIREVDLAGYPAVALTNVSASNAGSYTVVISSPYGSVTSAVATLTVSIPRTAPQIITSDGYFGFLTNQFGFSLSGAFGQTIVVDGSTNLANWTPLSTNTVGGSPFYFSDPAWTNFPWRFYRARLP
jgi:sugar lactone lactonase YvrE